GVRVLSGRRALLDATAPFQAGGDMLRVVHLDRAEYAPLPEKFEAGTQAIAEVIGLGAAVDYLQDIGLDAIHAHEQRLTEYAFEAFSEVPGLRIFGPPPTRRAG